MSDVESQVVADVREQSTELDALIIGAGMSGIDELNRLRSAGFRVLAVDAAEGVGGTWYWNRYPGARLDSESYSYGYFFDEELFNGWDWSEHFCAQPENERYFNYVADKLDLRSHIKLGTTVESAQFDDESNTWTVRTTDGDTYRTRFLITAIGILSDPRYPSAPGREKFTGRSFHTARWPHEPVDVSGKRVAVIGTGASGVQTISAIGPQVGSLTVFQRSANWCPPLNNGPLSVLEMAELKGKFEALKASTQSRGGFVHGTLAASAQDYTPEQRRAWYEHLFTRRGFARFYTNFPEIARSQELNDEYSAFIAEKIRARVNDPKVADKLIPDDHGFGQKRPPFETNYYEVYNQPNVELIDVREDPIVEFTESGLRTKDREFEFDIIIYATGFNGVTGAFDRIDFTGANGEALAEHWKHGPRTYAGLGTHGFPNLLILGGPQAMGGNIPRCVEKQTPFVSNLLTYMREHGYTRAEATEHACQQWADHISEIVEQTLYANHKSWFWAKKDDEDRVFGIYPGGVVVYGQQLSAIEADQYKGFELS